jgi:acetylornithine deacetylase/succinyl-diaminopimelate desuccinylase-like protein
MRTLPGQSKEEILKRIEEIAQKIPAKHGFTVDVKVHVPAALSDPDAPFIHKVVQVHREVFGNQPSLKGSGPANESYMLIQRGISTVAGYGPSGGGFHAANEFAHVESIEKSLQFLEQLALR